VSHTDDGACRPYAGGVALFRYSRWDGTQDPFGPDVPSSDILEELSDDILMGDPADRALQRLFRRGMRGRFGGLDAMRRQLDARREDDEARLNLAGPLEELRERLDDILDRERSRLSLEPDEQARVREAFLDALPNDIAGQLKELQDYRFVDPEAQRRLDELMEHLKEQVLGAYFRNMAQGLRGLSPEQLARFKDMLSELNGLIEMQAGGQDVQPAFDDFMSRYGDLFPERPRTLEELLAQMARRMAAMSRLLASLSDEQRQQLQDLVDQVMQDMDLAFELDRLGANLAGAFPEMPWGEPTWGMGEDAAPMAATVDALEREHEYEDLERSLEGDYPGASLEDVDEDAVRRILGEPAARDLRRLREIERMLEDAGLMQRRGGRLELTPRGARKLGERALTRVFERLQRDREGAHEARDPGGAVEPTGQTRPWRFGDHGTIAVQRSVFNAVARGGAAGPGEPVRLVPDDFELVEAEQRT
jgi:uncharacterized protein with von Willebrand factor type A (vWA) domain